MLSFRKKIFLTYLLTFLLLISLIYPGANILINRFIYRALENRAEDFIKKIQTATDNDAAVRRLRSDQHLTFFRISIITDKRKVLYDSHSKRLLGPRFTQEFIVDHKEVIEAFKNGIGFNDDYSDLLGSRFIYFAKAFDFHGKRYVMRMAFPQEYIGETSREFRMIMLLYSSFLLAVFGVLSWLTVNHFTRPIQRIIEQVSSYHEEANVPFPYISVRKGADEFSRLAQTLNALSEEIQHQINNLTEERNEKSALLEALVEGVIAVDRHQNIVYCNRIAAKMLDLNGEDLKGKPITSLKRSAVISLLSQSGEQQTTLTGVMELSGFGGRTYLNMLSAPKGQEGGAILILQDQSQHHRILNMRKQFIANASHELKTPITIIRGFAETLHDNTHLSSDTVQEITSKIVRNCQRMTILVKDLLALADIEHLSQSRLLQIDLVDLLNNCKTTLLDLFSDAQIEIAPAEDDEYVMVGDPSLLEMAFYNLLNNAAKYSNAPAKIKVSLVKQNDNIELLFADQGIGIPEEELENVFQRFYTVDSQRMRKMGGSGLGLSLVETIIEKHHGKISLTSKVGVGTTFCVVLPISQPANNCTHPDYD